MMRIRSAWLLLAVSTVCAPHVLAQYLKFPDQTFPNLILPNDEVPEMRKVEFQCSICGCTLYENVKVDVVGDRQRWGDNIIDQGFTWGVPGYNHEQIPDSVLPRTLQFSAETSKICLECARQYGQIVGELRNVWDTWWADALKDKKESRQKWDAQRKADVIQGARKKLKDAQQELQWLEHPKDRPTPVKSRPVIDTAGCTSISIRLVDTVKVKSSWLGLYNAGADSVPLGAHWSAGDIDSLRAELNQMKCLLQRCFPADTLRIKP